MRLALLLPSLAAGGAERVASRLAAHWAELGHEVHLLLMAGPGQRPYYALAPQVRLHELGLLGRSRGPLDALGANLARVRRLRRAIAELGPAAVLAFLPETGALAALATAGRGRPPVIIAERNSPDEPLPRAWRAARWLAHHAAAAVVFQTERARAAFAGPAAAAGRGVVIPNPVALPAEPCADPEATALVAAGRLVPQKGFDILLEAFAGLAPRHPAWTLTIWGEGPERARLRALAERPGLAGRVRLPGVSDEPGGWLRGGSVFVLPSRFEGFPNALCEAMAAGYAVVAADCRFGPREIVSDGEDGLLAAPESPTALAAALERLMTDAARRRALGAAARRSVGRFDPALVAGRWDGLLAAVAAGRRPS